jgi:hypothetical protein
MLIYEINTKLESIDVVGRRPDDGIHFKRTATEGIKSVFMKPQIVNKQFPSIPI